MVEVTVDSATVESVGGDASLAVNGSEACVDDAPVCGESSLCGLPEKDLPFAVPLSPVVESHHDTLNRMRSHRNAYTCANTALKASPLSGN